MKTIEVCLSPALFQYKATNDDYIVVIVDVLRATTAFCAAFNSEVESVVPVSGLDELRTYKSNGFITAAERDGNKVDFADFGNSPTIFLKNKLKGKNLAYSTTNGTQAIEKAKIAGAGNIVAAAFVNIEVACKWIVKQGKNVVILCSGWKNTFSLEDTLCAGALVEILVNTSMYGQDCDASIAALSLWKSKKNRLVPIVQQASHYKRLLAKGLTDDLNYCFTVNSSKALPVWTGECFKDLSVK
jgi:2-phosphosulfolactate phosphatase